MIEVAKEAIINASLPTTSTNVKEQTIVLANKVIP
jgi:hypothetical protein